ncbi:RNA binding protein, putative [Ichthyophthirius multifiliis]|uniref:RNA binding protein, putative n=1 Tax=Ichthyophthirius multifiliis TaxID=5932 RepID=G0R511_ICHMU|nr:RNA binding protein, putative [Ichthyophthirius multifiliis]EGR27413.1 RNA binding protein, putative [Ichthyophthirius multifiliis]|eukprot:XP_004024323.1 RNA binding protein, putative [Ichthyophthirius multifiliis]
MYTNKNIRLPPEVNRVVYVRNLPYKITAEELYDVFGNYGPIRQIRKGVVGDKKGTAFVIYDDIFDAKTAVEHLNGFNVGGRYLIVLYYQPHKLYKKTDLNKKQEEIDRLKNAQQ